MVPLTQRSEMSCSVVQTQDISNMGQIDAIHCIIKIGLNLLDVTRCNGLHHKNRNDFNM